MINRQMRRLDNNQFPTPVTVTVRIILFHFKNVLIAKRNTTHKYVLPIQLNTALNLTFSNNNSRVPNV